MKIIKKIALLVLLAATSFRAMAYEMTYPPSLTNEIDGTVVGASTLDLVVFIHGWNFPYQEDAYSNPVDWGYLTLVLKSRLSDSNWKLVLYDWHTDAATPLPTDAANRALDHGNHLGIFLANTCPQLRRVHFITHSAGAWAAREAATVLILRNKTIKVQMTLLDPFIPVTDPNISDPLSITQMNDAAKLPRIYRLENYFSKDDTGKWTEQQFTSWQANRDINKQVDYIDDGPINPPHPYSGHGGPIVFYADTVEEAEGYTCPSRLHGVNCPFVSTQVGWYRSMLYESPAPHITTDLVDQPINAGDTAMFHVAATGTEPLSYSWFMNDSWISVAVGPTLSATAAGQYRVVIQDANGHKTQSRIAVLTVNSVASPVAITAPGAGAVLSGTTTVTANAIDATSVEFWLDGVRRYTDASTPFSWAWDTNSTSDGSHQIVAKAYSGTTLLGFTAPRSVTVANQPPYVGSDPYEPNDLSTLATSFSFGSTLLAYIDSPTDVDWFKVNVTTSGTLFLNLNVPDGKDYDLELYGPDGLWMTGSYLPAGVDEAILQSVTEPGTYYCRVYGWPVGAGSFSASEPYALTSYFTNSGSDPPAGSTVWSGTVDVTGDVTIATGNTLTIMPGTQVRFHALSDSQASGTDKSRCEIILNGGTLTVNGTAGAPIVFTSAGPTKSAGDWYGIRVVSGDVTLGNCVVEYAVTGISFECQDTRLSNYSLHDVTVQRCRDRGVWTTSGGSYTLPVVMTGFQVINNSGDGIYSNGAVKLVGCTLSHNNGMGLRAITGSSSNSVEVTGSTVQTNTSGGLDLEAGAVVGLAGNTISQNLGNGLSLGMTSWNGGGESATGITGNVITGNTGVGVQVNGNAPAVLTISGNDIYQNAEYDVYNSGSCAVVANGNYWGDQTGTQLSQGVQNLTRIYDIWDGAPHEVLIRQWYAAPLRGGNPGPLQNYNYGISGATAVAGTINSPQAWSGTVLVVGDVTVNGSLAIAPGTQVLFAPLQDTQAAGLDRSRSEIILNGGTLNVNGTAGAPVVFTSAGPTKSPGDWYGIRVVSGDVTLGNCVVEYAVTGISFECQDTRLSNYSLHDVTVQRCRDRGVWTTSGGSYTLPVVMTGFQVINNSGDGIYSNGAVKLVGCTLSHNNGMGLRAITGSSSNSVEVTGSTVQTNTSGGLDLEAGAVVGLAGNTISQNLGNGLSLGMTSWNGGGESATGITGNVITGNTGYGVQVSGNTPAVLTISGNDIYQNAGYDLYNSGSCAVVANGNYWGDQTGTQLSQGVQNLTRIYDIRDGAQQQVVITQWYASSLSGGNPGSLQNFTYGVSGVTLVAPGMIDSPQTWTGTVLVVGDVTVNSSLTITPGTQVLFPPQNDTLSAGTDRSRSEIILNGGTLNVNGTAGAPVVFTSAGPTKSPGDWYGIRVVSGDVTLGNCVVEYAVTGISFECQDTRLSNYSLHDVTVQRCRDRGVWTTSGGSYTLPVVMTGFQVINNSGDGIYSNGAVKLVGCTLSHNNGMGLRAITGSSSNSVEVTGSTVQTNTGGGLDLEAGAVVGLAGNTISQNLGNGLSLGMTSWNGGGESATGITGNVITGNTGYGVQVSGNTPAVLTISGNDIYQNASYDLYNSGSCAVVANGNYWGDQTGTQLSQGVQNLTRIYDIWDGAPHEVLIRQWYAAPLRGGNPGPLQNYNYGISGATAVTGTINSPQAWSGTVLVVGDVTVNGSLAIAPGTQVLFAPLQDTQAAGLDRSRSEIILNGGTLNVNGTAGAPVVFTSAGPTKSAGDWYGIRVVSGDVTLGNCVVEYAVTGISFECQDTRLSNYSLHDVTVQRCRDRGVWTTSGGSYTLPVVMTGFQVINNSGDGIYSNGAVKLVGCTLSHNNGMGLRAITGSSSNSVEVTGSTVQINTSGGLDLEAGAVVGLADNTISQNLGNGLSLGMTSWNGGGESATGITGNVITGNTGVGVQVNGNAPAVLTISGNDIYQNAGFDVRNDSNMSIIAANGYWGEPTTTEFYAGQANLTRIYDSHDSSSSGQVLIQSIRGSAAQLAPRFTQQPQSLSANVGDTVVLSPLVSGAPTITYQWYFNNHALPQANGLILTLSNVTPATAGSYYLVASNASGTATSEVAYVAIVQPLVVTSITQQPQSQTVIIGGTASFSVAVTGTGPFTYQWRKNGTNLSNSSNISGATTAAMTLANVQLPDAGNYSVVVTNTNGSVTSTAATLTVNVDPLAASVNSPGLVWTTGGNAPWFAQTATTYDGVDAARSGAITDSQESTMQTTLIGSGTLSFWWKVSSEDSWDVLEFYLDGVLQSAPISGETNWQQRFLTIPAGSHTVKWRYVKDNSMSSGQDAGWVDGVNFVTDILAPPLATTSTANGISASSATLNGTVNPNGLSSTALFEYGLTGTYGSKVRVTLSPNNGLSVQNVSVSLSGLQSGKTYHYRLTATSSGGTSQGGDMTFATPAVPIVATELVAPKMEICDGDANLTIQASVPGRAYQLQCSDTMAPDTWQDLGPVRIGDGNILVISTPCNPVATRQFYRIALQE